jgi:hypothetical protein
MHLGRCSPAPLNAFMETFLLIVLIPVFFGIIVGEIVLISKYVKLIKIKNRWFQIRARALFIILFFIFLNIPALLMSFKKPLHYIYGYYKLSTYENIMFHICVVWYLPISIIGNYTVYRDWYRKFKSIKKYNPAKS